MQLVRKGARYFGFLDFMYFQSGTQTITPIVYVMYAKKERFSTLSLRCGNGPDRSGVCKHLYCRQGNDISQYPDLALQIEGLTNGAVRRSILFHTANILG